MTFPETESLRYNILLTPLNSRAFMVLSSLFSSSSKVIFVPAVMYKPASTVQFAP